MGTPASRGPVDKAFEGGMPLPVSPTAEPQLGKLFQFNQAPQQRQGPIPTKTYPPELGDFSPMTSAPPVPPVKPPAVATAAPSPEEPEGTRISAERLAFLERVEALVAAESQINDLQMENRALLSIVSRLQRELEGFKKGAPKA